MENLNRLIVIEGLDGSGKATQVSMLEDWLLKSGIPCRKITFPDYGSKSSELVKMYLSGEIDTLDNVNAYAASIFYASDRYISFVKNWKDDYRLKTIIADRYTTSNIVHQMSKLPGGEWDNYISWLYDLEYQRIKIPKPSIVIYLDMDPDVSQNLIKKRNFGDTTKIDIHEKDKDYLKKCRKAALFAGEKLGWHIVNCSSGAGPYSKEQIAMEIKNILKECFTDMKGLI